MRASDFGGTRSGLGPTSRTRVRYTVNARRNAETPHRLTRARCARARSCARPDVSGASSSTNRGLFEVSRVARNDKNLKIRFSDARPQNEATPGGVRQADRRVRSPRFRFGRREVATFFFSSRERGGVSCAILNSLFYIAISRSSIVLVRRGRRTVLLRR